MERKELGIAVDVAWVLLTYADGAVASLGVSCQAKRSVTCLISANCSSFRIASKA